MLCGTVVCGVVVCGVVFCGGQGKPVPVADAVEFPDGVADVLLGLRPLVVLGPAVPVVVAFVLGELAVVVDVPVAAVPVAVVPVGTQLGVAPLLPIEPVEPAVPELLVPPMLPVVPVVADCVPAGVPLLLLVVGFGMEGLDCGVAGAAVGVAAVDGLAGLPMVEVAPLVPVAVELLGVGVVIGLVLCVAPMAGAPGAPALPAVPVCAMANAVLMQLTANQQSSLFKIAPRDLSSEAFFEV